MKRKVPNISENSKKKKAKMEEENPLETFLDNDSENVLDFFKLPEIEDKVVQLVSSEKLWRKLYCWSSEALLKILEEGEKDDSEKILKNCVHLIRVLLESTNEDFTVNFEFV